MRDGVDVGSEGEKLRRGRQIWGEQGVSEGGIIKGRQGGREMKEGRQVGKSME